jgi:ribose/xylose/arabinose/galactoside ABC-type transport system permease subunit
MAKTGAEKVIKDPAKRGIRDRLRTSDQVRTQVPLLAVLISVSVYAALSSPLFLSKPNIQVLLDSVAILGLVTVGMSILLIAGQLDLSVGAAATLTSVMAAKVIVSGQSELAAIIVGVGLAVAIGVAVGVVVVLTNVQPFILTLGLLSVLQSISLLQTGQRPLPIGSAFRELDRATVADIPLTFVVFVGALVIGFLILQYTRLGRNFYAVGSNREAAFLAGIRVKRVTIAAYALSGFVVGIAGIFLLANLGAGDASSGNGLELRAIAAAVIGGATLVGGRGSMLGSFLGVLLLGLIANALTLLNVSSFYQLLTLGALLIFAVVTTAIAETRRQEGAKFDWRKIFVRQSPGGAPPTGSSGPKA